MRYLVLGAGLTGLTAAFHLPRDSTIVLEAENTAGGLCRSVVRGDYRFDRTGHFLHFRNERARAFVDNLLPEKLATHVRNSAIRIFGNDMPQPFQSHLAWLPDAVRRECLVDFVKACAARIDEPISESKNLSQWFHRSFGKGITRHFLDPQNRKTYCCEMTELDALGVIPYVAQPSIEQVIDGALFREAMAPTGYNSEFLYPKDGGIQILPDAIVAQLENVHYSRRVVAVDSIQRKVRCVDGTEYEYENIVSTLPLDKLIEITRGLRSSDYTTASGLRSVDVLDIRLGIASKASVPYHWLYLPEAEFPFTRAVIPSNVSSTAAPRGHCAIHLEFNCRSGERIDAEEMIRKAILCVREIGIVAADCQVEFAAAERIQSAYVVQDHHRREVLPDLLGALSATGIYSVGRYGGWGYGGMESAILDGIGVAEKLLAQGET